MKSTNATWMGKVLAASDDCILVEGNQYFPKDSVDLSLLKRSEHTTFCPWKGHATYYHAEIDGQIAENAVWTYENPSPQALRLKDHFAYWGSIEVQSESYEQKIEKIANKLASFRPNEFEDSSRKIENLQSFLSELGPELLSQVLPTEFIKELSFFNFSNSNDACFQVNHLGVIDRVNPTFAWEFASYGDCTGLTLEELLEKFEFESQGLTEVLDTLKSHCWTKIDKIESVRGDKKSYYSLDLSLSKHGHNEELSGYQGQFKNRTVEVELTQSLAVSRRSMRILLDGLEEGLFYFDSCGSIAGERSAALEKILPGSHEFTDIREFIERFSKIPKDSVQTCMELLWPSPEDAGFFSDFDTTISMLPRNIQVEASGETKDIQFQYLPIHHAETQELERILVIVKDQTDFVRNAKNAAKQAERVERFTSAASQPEAFQGFVREGESLVARLNLAFQNGDSVSAEMKRDLHTLKGSASLFFFRELSTEIHKLEDQISRGESPLAGEWQAIAQIWDQETADIMQTLGLSIDQSKISIDRDKVEHLLVKTADTPELHDLVCELFRHPASHIFHKYSKLIQRLSEESDEKEVVLSISDSSCELSFAEIERIDGAFLHLLRNAFDHGIEADYQRASEGKPPIGTLTVETLRSSSGEIRIVLTDDGGGIQTDRLVQKAVEKGFWTQEYADKADHKEKIELIFQSGMSSKDQASELSGRGVGMDAARKAIEELGGRLQVSTELCKGSRFEISLPHHDSHSNAA